MIGSSQTTKMRENWGKSVWMGGRIDASTRANEMSLQICLVPMLDFQCLKRWWQTEDRGKITTTVSDNVFIYPGFFVHILFLVVHNINTHLSSFVHPSSNWHQCIACVLWYIFVVELPIHRGKSTHLFKDFIFLNVGFSVFFSTFLLYTSHPSVMGSSNQAVFWLCLINSCEVIREFSDHLYNCLLFSFFCYVHGIEKDQTYRNHA